MGITAELSPTVMLTLLMIFTMMLSDVLNNAATAVVMAPFGWTLAQHLGVNPDPFPHGCGHWCFLCVSHTHRAPKQSLGHGTRRVSIWGLLAHGTPIRNI